MKTLEELRKIAEDAFNAHCIACKTRDKEAWMNGFIAGYLNSNIEILQNDLHNKNYPNN